MGVAPGGVAVRSGEELSLCGLLESGFSLFCIWRVGLVMHLCSIYWCMHGWAVPGVVCAVVSGLSLGGMVGPVLWALFWCPFFMFLLDLWVPC